MNQIKNIYAHQNNQLYIKEQINISIKDKVFINRNGNQGSLSKINPNLFAVEGVYLLEK